MVYDLQGSLYLQLQFLSSYDIAKKGTDFSAPVSQETGKRCNLRACVLLFLAKLKYSPTGKKNNAIHQCVHLIHITITVFLLSYEVWELCLSQSLWIVSVGKHLVHSSSYIHFLSEIQCNNVLHEYLFCVKFGIGVSLPGKQEETNKMASMRTQW